MNNIKVFLFLGICGELPLKLTIEEIHKHQEKILHAELT